MLFCDNTNMIDVLQDVQYEIIYFLKILIIINK